MVSTLTLIAKQTVGANGASSVTFSNIPQTYTDLKVVSLVYFIFSSFLSDPKPLTVNPKPLTVNPKPLTVNHNSGTY